MQIEGPGSAFQCLIDEDTTSGAVLPPEFQAVYGRWPLPAPTTRPYTYINFVTSRDGRISFNEPGKSSGGPVSGFNQHDRWGMALLRARADAVIMGASALADAPRQTATAQAIFPKDADAWHWLRQHEGRAPVPLHVVVTRSGRLNAASIVLTDSKIEVLVVTTDEGAQRAHAAADDQPNVRVLSTGDAINYVRLGRHVREEYGVATLLSEAGPNIYGGLLAAGVVDDEFVTLSPIVVGGSDEKPRPSLIEGVAFDPDHPPRSRLLTLRRSGDFLFLQSRYTTNDEESRTGQSSV